MRFALFGVLLGFLVYTAGCVYADATAPISKPPLSRHDKRWNPGLENW